MATIFSLGGSESNDDPAHPDTGNVGIDLISSQYKARIVNTNVEVLFEMS